MNLDPTKCNISLGNGALAGKLKSLKSSFSKGLSGISTAVGGVLGSLEKALSPKAFQSFAAEFLKLDRLNSGALAKFKEKWGKAVDGLDGMLENIETFDICSILEKGDVKLDAAGNKVTTAPPLAVPEAAPEAITPAPAPATNNAADYRSDIAKEFKITAGDALQFGKDWRAKLKKLVIDPARLQQKSLDKLNKDFGKFIRRNRKEHDLYVSSIVGGRKATEFGAKENALGADSIGGRFVDRLGEFQRSMERLRAQIKLLTTWGSRIQLKLEASESYEDLYKKDLLIEDFFSPADRAHILLKITTTPGKLIGSPSYNISLQSADYEIIKSMNETAGIELWKHRDLWLGYLIGTRVIH